jgi:hypothetical protein
LQQNNLNGSNQMSKRDANKKNKIPFSFLMHHYMKTNAGKQVAAADPNVVGAGAGVSIFANSKFVL